MNERDKQRLKAFEGDASHLGWQVLNWVLCIDKSKGKKPPNNSCAKGKGMKHKHILTESGKGELRCIQCNKTLAEVAKE